jgi:D-alanyl-D-alanine dipeptidase
VNRWLVVALVACGNGGTTSAPHPVPDPPRPTPMLLPVTTQLVTGVIDGWDSTTATLQLWSRKTGAWQKVGDPWPAVIGSAGAAWGDGLHGSGAPADRSGPRKHEGDRKSPAGVFDLRAAYGYAPKPPDGTAWTYRAVDDNWVCVDDPKSDAYTAIVDKRMLVKSWASAEEMRRTDELYTWVVDIAHNPSRIAGDGSCIFMHVWRGADSTTVGCTAMAEPKLAHLLGTLDPNAQPVYVLLPRAEYQALAAGWGLPPL